MKLTFSSVPAVVPNSPVSVYDCLVTRCSSLVSLVDSTQLSPGSVRVIVSHSPKFSAIDVLRVPSRNLLYILLLKALSRRSPVIPVPIPKVSKLSHPLSRVKSSLAVVIEPTLERSSPPGIVSLGHESSLGTSVDPPSTVVSSHCVLLGASSDVVLSLSSYPSWATFVTSVPLALTNATLEQHNAKKELSLKLVEDEVGRLSKQLKDATDKLASVEKEMDSYQLELVNSQLDTDHYRMKLEDKDARFEATCVA
ncbi:hypothetical protein L1987_40754 [Smallanthus sonchifolius]|uniref:Uncharacterized protein n=1 Tax=Smallanthus sonchifolius TaxID=185202 RepID=A0ACB9GU96_9ASTR|nr:hypothetical protein L1987_40754 [Smallanthus sonchifolius]